MDCDDDDDDAESGEEELVFRVRERRWVIATTAIPRPTGMWYHSIFVDFRVGRLVWVEEEEEEEEKKWRVCARWWCNDGDGAGRR